MSTQHTAHSTQPQLDEKLVLVKNMLAEFKRVVVAFSGGVDSTLLAKLARDVLGKPNALAVTADSPSLSRADLTEAKRLAAQLDLWHRVIETKEVGNPLYRANTEGRCFVCRQTLFTELEELAYDERIPVVLYGAIGDDLLSERPGQRAALQFGVRSPLQEAGLAKWDVRELARLLGIPNWDRPQNACLSSRIPHGHEVDERKLRQIEQAEAFLREQGFKQVRVRHLETHARIEVPCDEVGRFQDASLQRRTAEAFSRLGFLDVAVDWEGYRPGGADHTPSNEPMLILTEPHLQNFTKGNFE